MYHHLNQVYFPEVESPVGGSSEVETFHEF
jgi:hypothetical protein